MRKTLLLTLSVLICAVALCLVAQAALNRAVDAALDMERRAAEAASAGNIKDAARLAAELDRHWQDSSRLLELTVSHDALHDAVATIAEARIHLRYESDVEDFLCAMSAIEAGLTRLREEEALRWENLY